MKNITNIHWFFISVSFLFCNKEAPLVCFSFSLLELCVGNADSPLLSTQINYKGEKNPPYRIQEDRMPSTHTLIELWSLPVRGSKPHQHSVPVHLPTVIWKAFTTLRMSVSFAGVFILWKDRPAMGTRIHWFFSTAFLKSGLFFKGKKYGTAACWCNI